MTAVRNLFGILMLAMAAYIIWPVVGPAISNLVGHTKSNVLEFKRVNNVAELEAQIANARGKTVMLDFYADWCTYCKQFEDYVFSNKEVQNLLKDFVLLQADVTANDAGDQALNKFTSVMAPPAILFFAKDGKEIRNYRIVGNMDAKTFIKHVTQITKK
jgi:thiol:disulfide interchange protein DsbD